MPSAFIIRPFGTKNGIDFNRVESELIAPALTGHKLTGRTTGDTLKQGNIRTEMFQRLLTADVVIVDISIDNANVYYELGIRHALRNKRTFMIRGSSVEVPANEVPFDLRTDRYLPYDAANPGSALEELKEGLRQTLLSEEKDSPVFQLLPELVEQDKWRFLAVPADFQDEVERAIAQKCTRNQWGDLKLLQTEVGGLQWEVEGWRVVGRAQFRNRAYEHARDTWEAVLSNDPNDKEANTWLGTIYHRLGNLPEADIKLQNVLEHKATTEKERAEAHSLFGRNQKEKWKAEWADIPAEQQRQAAALGSPLLELSYEHYRKGFIEDLDNYYSGINALGMLTIMTTLATACPEVWNGSFQDDEEGERELKNKKAELAKLSGSVTLSLEAAKARTERAGTEDVWSSITLADLDLLTSKRPLYVAGQYRKALVNARGFEIDSVRRQLEIYEQLAVAPDTVAEALKVIPSPDLSEDKPPHVLLFTGHRIDSPEREKPRFPADKEDAARQAIRNAVEKELRRMDGGEVIGIAGGASGGDILFHEVCAELQIPTSLYLAIPRDEYVKESVRDGGAQWVDRFNELYQRLPRRELCKSKELPRWLQSKPDYTVWQRNNLWMLYNAMARGSAYVTLIALWDGEAGDGPGGTMDMVNRADESGAKTMVLPTKEIFGL